MSDSGYGPGHPGERKFPASNVSEAQTDLGRALLRIYDLAENRPDIREAVGDAIQLLGRAALAHAAPEGLDVERLRRAIDNVNEMDPLDYLDAGDTVDAYIREYVRLSQPDWREASKRLHRDGDDEPYTDEAGRADRVP